MKALLTLLTLIASTFGGIGFANEAAAARTQPAASANGSAAHHHHYQVLYCHGGHWDVYGTYESYDEARHIAHDLQHQGYHTRVREVF